MSNSSSTFLPTNTRLKSTLALIHHQRYMKKDISSAVSEITADFQLNCGKFHGSSSQLVKNQKYHQKKTNSKLYPLSSKQLLSSNCLTDSSLSSEIFENITNDMNKSVAQSVSPNEKVKKKQKIYHNREQKVLSKTNSNTKFINKLLTMTDSDSFDNISNIY
ncbi:unnamed protein product, partial [Didymodactylos carnosus]